MNKKGIFLPLMAIMTLIFSGIFIGIFYFQILKDRSENVGEHASNLINFYTQQEMFAFSIQESAKLAACDTLQTTFKKGLLKTESCFLNTYAVWDFKLSDCNPDPAFESSDFKEEFEKKFKERTTLVYKNINYEFRNKIKIKATTDPLLLEKVTGKLDIDYKLNINFNQELNVDVTKIQGIINEANNLNTCLLSQSFEVCSKSSNLECIKSDSLIKCNVQNIKNPCTNEDIAFKFALKSNSNVA
ncbi:MAG: hypothetical protein PHD81_02205 [Candidatus Nanoarchaeia archaeon]|nr:hypothetical protein [Candidatus Nanoarchaeia archaeon]MDD5587903.1 hypothetical protein [Candidatus Nanoarchaeia archaeon]